ncbi:tetraspanin-18-like [Saccostrea echinata]|uniref:tetraspanin-18-like n=1 Tax=Saccostrea echinata TaxID=191078 RepID=UPI002A81A87E|nr:tetraspanin-18-like [Saccostrea echinata]
MGLTGCGKLGKGFLIVINIIFFLLGLGLLIGGILMKVNVSAINDEVKPALNGISVSSFKLGDLVDNLSILFIVMGAFVLLVAGLGLFGACCEVKCMLAAYAILVLLLFIIKVTAVALWFTMKGEVEDTVKDSLLKSLKENYKTDLINGSNVVSNAWNYMFMSVDCCGVNSSRDFLGFSWTHSLSSIPRTCCKNVDSATYLKPTCTPGYNEKGCYDTIKDDITTYGNVFAGVGITILFIELLAVVFAIMICCQTGKEGAI